MVLSAKIQAYMTTGGTFLASIGGAMAILNSGLAGLGTNQPQNAVIGAIMLGIGLIIKYEKQLQSVLGLPEVQNLIDTVSGDIQKDIEVLKNSHGSLSDRVAALEAANTDVPAATATAINPTQPAPTPNA